ncbi:MAG: homogentisate 1,2-dioxygenase [Legionellales bacterium]|nr:homogentisate 1,2-dioxygenase [Legionellales bacterium]
MSTIQYQSGFHNHFASEALKDALPRQQNNPQQVPLGLYAEQLSGSAFTQAYRENFRTWFYRLLPSVAQGEFKSLAHPRLIPSPFNHEATPNPLRWQPLPYPEEPTDFLMSLTTYAGCGSAHARSGAAIHLYSATANMENTYFYNSDGELLIVPQEGSLLLKTECGDLSIAPSDIALIPRGLKFQVDLIDKKARGYVLENFGLPFTLPEPGVIGPNALAQARFFQAPTARYEKKHGKFTLITKFQEHLFSAEIDHSPLDVVAWHGNLVPYKYDLRSFCPINSVRFDHVDPSIATVLTSPSSHPGIANIDFVIFPERWLTMEHTMRLPYFHRNIMSEFMGLITGHYDAKHGGFVPGGASLHNCMTPHGPDQSSYEHAITAALKPQYYQHTLAFMFESQSVWVPTPLALEASHRDKNYQTCWQGFKSTTNVG